MDGNKMAGVLKAAKQIRANSSIPLPACHRFGPKLLWIRSTFRKSALAAAIGKRQSVPGQAKSRRCKIWKCEYLQRLKLRLHYTKVFYGKNNEKVKYYNDREWQECPPQIFDSDAMVENIPICRARRQIKQFRKIPVEAPAVLWCFNKQMRKCQRRHKSSRIIQRDPCYFSGTSLSRWACLSAKTAAERVWISREKKLSPAGGAIAWSVIKGALYPAWI